jgi:hypothetical protein
MNGFRRLLLLGLILFVSGCATVQQPIAMSTDAVPTASTVGVAMTALPATDLLLPGADCLLCIATAVATNSSLNSYAKTLPREDVAAFKEDIAVALRSWGAQVTVVPEDLPLATLNRTSGSAPNTAELDFAALRGKYKVDRLLVVQVDALGMVRPYAAYIPSGPPKALLRGRAFLVNLSNNLYEWYKPFDLQKAAEGQWNEPPKFPGLTNAYFQVIELGREDLVKTLTRK